MIFIYLQWERPSLRHYIPIIVSINFKHACLGKTNAQINIYQCESRLGKHSETEHNSASKEALGYAL